MILAIRTDAPISELYLYSEAGEELARDIWESGRQLSVQLHTHIEQLLKTQSATYEQLRGVIVFQGPGSFTGLRIGITVANTLAYGLNIPIAAAQGVEWQHVALNLLSTQTPGNQVLPYYGGEANITRPRK